MPNNYNSNSIKNTFNKCSSYNKVNILIKKKKKYFEI